MSDTDLNELSDCVLASFVLNADREGRVYDATHSSELAELLNFSISSDEIRDLIPLVDVLKRFRFFNLAEAYFRLQEGSSSDKSIDVYRDCRTEDGKKVIVHVNLQKTERGHYTLSIHDSTKMDHKRRTAEGLFELYHDSLGVAAHELNGDLTALGILCGNFRRMISSPDRTLRNVAVLEDTVKDMLSSVSKYLDLSKLESGKYTPTIEDIAVYSDIIRPINLKIRQIKDVPIIFGEHGSAMYESIPSFSCDADSFRLAYRNILSNAIKYGGENTEIFLNYNETETDAFLSVKNTGSFIKEDELGSLFRRFSRISRLEAVAGGGTGLGLYNARERLRCTGGDITASSDGRTYAEFTIKVGKSQRD